MQQIAASRDESRQSGDYICPPEQQPRAFIRTATIAGILEKRAIG
jgi:hypothetical protein